MDNKKLGLLIIVLSLLFSLLLWSFNNQIRQLGVDSCVCAETCDASHEPPYLVHGGIALVFATLSLGAYLLFFEKSHQTILRKLEDDTLLKSVEERFSFILMGLNDAEKKILTAIKEQPGITQHTLGLRTNLHKSKLSITVSMLENKGLIAKKKKGKTNQLFLRIDLGGSSKPN